MKLHELLLMERRKQEKNQRDIAEKVGISIGYYSRIERGKADAPLSVLTRICEEFGLSISHYVVDKDGGAAVRVEL